MGCTPDRILLVFVFIGFSVCTSASVSVDMNRTTGDWDVVDNTALFNGVVLERVNADALAKSVMAAIVTAGTFIDVY